MEASVETTKEVEARAAELGASAWMIAKWRVRGIPAKWQIKLFGLKSEKVEAPPSSEIEAEAAE